MSVQTFTAGLDKTPEALTLPATPDYAISQSRLEKWIEASKWPDQARVFASTFRYVSFEMWRAALHTALRAALRVPSAVAHATRAPSDAKREVAPRSGVARGGGGGGSIGVGGGRGGAPTGNVRVFYYPVAVDETMAECKSNYWVTNLALRMLRADAVLSGSEKVVRTADALARIPGLTRTVELVLFDDAIYSGTQVGKVVARCMAELAHFSDTSPTRMCANACT